MDFGAKLELLRRTPYLRSLPAPERVGTSITMSACCLTPAPPSNSVNSSAHSPTRAIHGRDQLDAARLDLEGQPDRSVQPDESAGEVTGGTA